jgi:hypothetical protein
MSPSKPQSTKQRDESPFTRAFRMLRNAKTAIIISLALRLAVGRLDFLHPRIMSPGVQGS